MARIRTIKPQHVNDKELSKISLQAHLFWVLSWCFSDDEGVLENDPLLLKSQIFPRRTDIRIEQVQQWIDQLIKARFVIPFTYNGEGYLLQRTFKIHQKIDRPQPSKIPENIIRRVIDEYSTNVRPCIVEYSSVEDSSISLPTGEPNLEKDFNELEKTSENIYKFISNNKPQFIEPYVALWNLFATKNSLSQVSVINDKRKKKFQVRIKEKAFDFIQILKVAGKSEFLLTGKWFGFDWIIENEGNYLKVIEGNYQRQKESNHAEQQHKSEFEKAEQRRKELLAKD
jgi:hypothetical protein